MNFITPTTVNRVGIGAAKLPIKLSVLSCLNKAPLGSWLPEPSWVCIQEGRRFYGNRWGLLWGVLWERQGLVQVTNPSSLDNVQKGSSHDVQAWAEWEHSGVKSLSIGRLFPRLENSLCVALLRNGRPRPSGVWTINIPERKIFWGCGKEDSWHPIVIWFKFLEGLKVYEITENSPGASFYKWGSKSLEGASRVSGGAQQGRWVKIIEWGGWCQNTS